MDKENSDLYMAYRPLIIVCNLQLPINTSVAWVYLCPRIILTSQRTIEICITVL